MAGLIKTVMVVDQTGKAVSTVSLPGPSASLTIRCMLNIVCRVNSSLMYSKRPRAPIASEKQRLSQVDKSN